MLGFENGLDIYATHSELNVRRVPGVKYKKYLAKIVGAHPTYGLSREFLRYKKRTSDHDHIYYNYGHLPDGVYETSVRYYPHGNTTDDPLEVVRKICVVSHGVTEHPGGVHQKTGGVLYGYFLSYHNIISVIKAASFFASSLITS